MFVVDLSNVKNIHLSNYQITGLEMILEAAILIVLLLFGWLLFAATVPDNLPPGPQPYPLIGNLIQLMSKPLHLSMTDLAKEYGKIYTVYLPFGQRCIVINSIGLAREALRGKKDDFSGRPQSFIGDYLTREGKGIVRVDFSQTLILKRKLVHSALRMYGSGPKLEETLCNEIEQLAGRFSARQGNAIDPRNDICLLVLNVISTVIYGERYELNDKEFQQIVKYNDLLLRLFFKGFNILEMFPCLRHFPLEEERILRKAREIRDTVLNTKYWEHKKKFEVTNNRTEIMINDVTDALLKAFYDDKENNGKTFQLLTEDHLVMMMNDVFNAAFQTATERLLWFLAYMVNYPDVQRLVQAELDDVVGHDRQPCLADKRNLPYLESTVTEVLRLATIAPLSVPHQSIQQSSLGGYDIPKDTIVVTNLWAIHRDTDEWDAPDVFNPKRFLDAEGNFSASGPKGFRSYLPFGAGRRGCLGESLARSELFLVCSRLLHQFNFKRASGKPLPCLTSHAGAAVIPGSYEISIEKRVY